MTAKQRKDKIILKKLSNELSFNNAYQKINFLFKGNNMLVDNKEIDEVVKLLESDHKELIKFIKSLKHK